MSFALIGSFALYSVFLYYQQLHSRAYRGASEAFGLFLAVFALVAMLSGGAFLLLYGYRESWLAAAGLFGAGIAARFIYGLIEGFLQIRWAAPYVSLTGFVALPVLAYLVWTSAGL